ncbi:MAG: hypothetical protein ACKPCI_32245 [Dolichospermum sp.]
MTTQKSGKATPLDVIGKVTPLDVAKAVLGIPHIPLPSQKTANEGDHFNKP